MSHPDNVKIVLTSTPPHSKTTRCILLKMCHVDLWDIKIKLLTLTWLNIFLLRRARLTIFNGFPSFCLSKHKLKSAARTDLCPLIGPPRSRGQTYYLAPDFFGLVTFAKLLRIKIVLYFNLHQFSLTCFNYNFANCFSNLIIFCTGNRVSNLFLSKKFLWHAHVLRRNCLLIDVLRWVRWSSLLSGSATCWLQGDPTVSLDTSVIMAFNL